jgi:hypothetical protein
VNEPKLALTMNKMRRASPLPIWMIWMTVAIANLVMACVLYATIGWYYIRGYREVVTFLIYPAILIQAGANLVFCCTWAGINLWRKSNSLYVAALAHLAAALLVPVSLPIAPPVGSVLKCNFILRTSIVDAAAYQDAELVKLHLQRGTDPNTRGQPGLNATALHYMAMSGNTEVVELLLQKGADPNARANVYCEYPLHGAVFNRAPLGTIRALLKHGADPKLRDYQGQSALDLAAGHPDPEGSLLRAALSGTSVDSLPRDVPSPATPPVP